MERMKHVDALSREVVVIEPLTFKQELMFQQLSDPEFKEVHENLLHRKTINMSCEIVSFSKI